MEPGDETSDDEEPRHVDERFSYANERTFLAWNRTALASVTGQAARPLLGAALLALGFLTWALGYWSSHQRRPSAGRPRPVATRRDLAPAAYGTAAVGIVGLVVALLGTR